jgi:post-segregation antitoxin (ccd killing protein)
VIGFISIVLLITCRRPMSLSPNLSAKAGTALEENRAASWAVNWQSKKLEALLQVKEYISK